MEITDYGNGWIGYTPMGPALPRELRPKPVASYRAQLPGNGSESTMTLADGVERAVLVAALNHRPEYMPFVWPDSERHTEADLRTLTLLKILAIVSFTAGWKSTDPPGLLAQAVAERPDLASRTTPWLRATGDVLSDGDATFGIEDISDDAEPTPDVLGGTDDPFIRAAMGVDLIRLIRAGQASWDPFRPAG